MFFYMIFILSSLSSIKFIFIKLDDPLIRNPTGAVCQNLNDRLDYNPTGVPSGAAASRWITN